MKKTNNGKKPISFKAYIYEVIVGGGVKGVFIFEQDAIDFAKKIGGDIRSIGAIK